jgi:WhiB family redox-sensing transcriptional regulator
MIIPKINPAEAAALVTPPERGPWEFENPTCAEIGPVPYYLDDDDQGREVSSYSPHHAEAVRLCKSCPHLVECLSWGTYREPYGIWGGTTPSQRRDIRRSIGINISVPQYAA